ncbi:MAG: PP2C family serine/threonine-protein phosphatase [Chryseolinea sp.]
MSDLKELVTRIFRSNTVEVPAHKKELFNRFIEDEQNRATIDDIIRNQNMLMARWRVEDRIADIIQQPVRILNATTGKPYEAKFDFTHLKWKDINAFEFQGLTEVGLLYDGQTKQITGTPSISGEFKIKFKFKIEGQSEASPMNEKTIGLIINPDPKTLWKNVASDKDGAYWKEDDVTVCKPINGRHLLASSKRGRSHANVGGFREDDFGYSEFSNGWGIVVVADGAGSAKYSRKGSSVACESVIRFFNTPESIESMAGFDSLVVEHNEKRSAETQKKINLFLYNNLGKAAFQAHKSLDEMAKATGTVLKDFATTLIFSLFKKYDIGYSILSFGIGDCPMAVLNTKMTKVIPLNRLDVGEFGGGTRFITMPEIFTKDTFQSRLDFQLVDDFSFLILMSDGIYDPKLVVESNLADVKKWHGLISDLQGENDDKIAVVLNAENKEITTQFSNWMDFWSTGNHDDRTLAIVF